MKTLAFCAILLLTSFSFAGEIGRFRNSGGGSIVFTDEPCKANPDTRFVYATTAAGSLTTGCWFYGGQEFFVVWENGNRSAYDLDGFELSKEYAARLRGAEM